MMFSKIIAIPKMQKIRYFTIFLACLAFIGPLAFLPQIAGGNDMCGPLCMRRFYLYYPGMTWGDLWTHMSVAFVGVFLFFMILAVTFFNGRLYLIEYEYCHVDFAYAGDINNKNHLRVHKDHQLKNHPAV